MRAVIYDKPGPTEVLKLGECKKPIPAVKEILVQVKATALNRADTLQRMGVYPPPRGASHTLGLEIAGVLVETGKSITQWKKGDKVFGLILGGGYAEFAVINENMGMVWQIEKGKLGVDSRRCKRRRYSSNSDSQRIRIRNFYYSLTLKTQNLYRPWC